MEQILLEERVVGLDHRHTEPAPEFEAEVMRHERRLDVDEIEVLALEASGSGANRASMHPAILRVEGQATRGNPQDARLVGEGRWVRRRDQTGFEAERVELAPEGLDRRGHPVHPREVHVRDHENLHRWARMVGAVRDAGMTSTALRLH